MGPALAGCRLMKRQDNGSLLWGVIVETEPYSQDDPLVMVGDAVNGRI